MKTNTSIFATFVATAVCIGGLAADQTPTRSATADAQAEASGNQTSTYKKTVTVTSDGKRTIKKTVEVRDGVEHVTTEVTDEDGKVTTTTSPGDAGQPPAEKPGGPWLGVRVKEASEVLREQLGLPQDRGAVIEVVAPGGPAAKAGVLKGDLLLTVATKPVAGPDDLAAELKRHQAGETVELELMRRGKTGTINVTLEERPADQTAEEPPPTPDYLLDDDHKNGGKIEIDGASGGAAFDKILDVPGLPAEFKDTVREMQERMREFERQHGNK